MTKLLLEVGSISVGLFSLLPPVPFIMWFAGDEGVAAPPVTVSAVKGGPRGQ